MKKFLTALSAMSLLAAPTVAEEEAIQIEPVEVGNKMVVEKGWVVPIAAMAVFAAILLSSNGGKGKKKKPIRVAD